ncbi:MAG: hypothetical protein FWH37_09700 [Candidatus Bathyarchaeota archaeon]|nr:hypothetical protein [Candidatus Termiticorpusculum sp.]
MTITRIHELQKKFFKQLWLIFFLPSQNSSAFMQTYSLLGSYEKYLFKNGMLIMDVWKKHHHKKRVQNNI